MTAPTLRTERLTLRHFEYDDLDALHAITGNPEAMRFYVDSLGAWTRIRTASFLVSTRMAWTTRGFGRWAVERDGALIGYCGFDVLDWLPAFGEAVELSFRFHPDQWGTGVGPEAGRAALGWAFTTLNVDGIVAATTVDNVRCRRAVAKLGMVEVGTYPYTSAASGRSAVFVISEVTREAWDAGRSPCATLVP